jgi:hypothetical protein
MGEYNYTGPMLGAAIAALRSEEAIAKIAAHEDRPLSIRDRAIVAEQARVANAKLALAPHDTEHEINIMVDSGSSLDDHRTESGYCPTCHLFINRTYNLVNGEVEDSLMSVEQRTLLEREQQREEARDFLDRLQRGGAKPARMDEDEPDQDTLNRRPYSVVDADARRAAS